MNNRKMHQIKTEKLKHIVYFVYIGLQKVLNNLLVNNYTLSQQTNNLFDRKNNNPSDRALLGILSRLTAFSFIA